MTADDEKDPPVPADVEGASLRRVHDGHVEEEPDPNDHETPAHQPKD
ncbi:hypothetical protein [Pseudarthrobacter sp. DSP2-3-2b1]